MSARTSRTSIQKHWREVRIDVEQGQNGSVYIDEIAQDQPPSPTNTSITLTCPGREGRGDAEDNRGDEMPSVTPQGGRKHPQQEFAGGTSKNLCSSAARSLSRQGDQNITSKAGIGFTSKCASVNERAASAADCATSGAERLVKYG